MTNIEDLLDTEGTAVELAEERGVQLRNLADVVMTRGHNRTRTLQVRLSDDEYAALEALANRRRIPVSSAARSVLLAGVTPTPGIAEALDRLESDIQSLRGQLTSA